MPLEVTNSPHNMPSISIEYPTTDQRTIIRAAVTCTLATDIRFRLAREAGAFLQCDSSDYILVEFWGHTYQPFVDWINKNMLEQDNEPRRTP